MREKATYRFNEETLDAIRELRRRFKTETGREPGPDDPYAFDPDSEDPQLEAREQIKSLMGDIADAAGLAADLVFAIRKTGLLVTHRNQDALDDDQRAAWNEAVAEYQTRRRLV